MKKSNQYLTTGEFAKLCNISKHTLFHYFEIGLFLPEYTDENGYRYYNVLQYDTFLTIRQLSDLGMSLSEIKEYLVKRSPQKMLELYSRQEELLDIQIKKLRAIKKSVHSQKNNIEKALLSTDKFFVEEENQKYLLCSKVIKDIDDCKMTYAFGELIKISKDNIGPNVYGMINKIDNIKNNDCSFQFYIQTTSRKKQNVFLKPAGKYLNMFHLGGYEDLHKSYKEILSYAKEHCLSLYSLIYTETIIGDWAVNSSKDYIIKISVQIKEWFSVKVTKEVRKNKKFFIYGDYYDEILMDLYRKL